jgi:hypothetical protein
VNNNTDGTEIIIFIAIVLVSLGFTLLIVQGQKKQILEHLKKKGAKNILVSWMPLDFDKSNHMYFVEYEDAQGTKHSTSCKIHAWGSSIYWTDEG